MLDPPPDKLIDEARLLASLKAKSIYMYKKTDKWYISESLDAISGHARILEIKPDTRGRSETDNFGGC